MTEAASDTPMQFQSTALCTYVNRQTMVMRGLEDPTLRWSQFDGTKWTFPGNVRTSEGALMSASAPVLIEYAGTLLMVYEGWQPKHQLYYTRWKFGDRLWENVNPVKAHNHGAFLEAKETPSLARMTVRDEASRVLMTYRGLDDYIHAASFDGTVWYDQGRISFES